MKKDDQKANKETEELRQQLEECENKYKRALADYQNLERRVQEERLEWIKSANKELILRLLPVLDILILANQHVKDEGLRLSVQQFLDALKNEGVERIETVGKSFDPRLMECVDTVEVDPSAGSGQGDGEVLTETRAGYTLESKVLRPALVKVGKKKSEKKEEEKAKQELQKGDYV